MLRPRSTMILLLTVFFGCDEDALAPAGPGPSVDLSIEPAVQWAGGTITATSTTPGVFVGDDHAIVVDGDTLDATSSADDAVEATLPNPRLTGPAIVELHLDGDVVADAEIRILGASRAPLRVECDPSIPSPCTPQLVGGAPLSYHGVGLPDGRLLAYVRLIGSSTEAGYGAARLSDPVPTFELHSGLELDALDGFPGLLAPGPSTEPGSWLLEASAEDTAEPPARRPLSAVGGSPEPLPCVGAGFEGGYVISETASGACLVLTHAPFAGVLQATWFCEPSGDIQPPAWPVFGADGGLAFASDRYPRWPKDAEFTSDGVLWVIGESIHGVAAGMVHLTAVWDGTSAPVDRGLLVASWDVQ